MRQAHTRSGRLCESIEDIVSADGDIGIKRVEPQMVWTSTGWDNSKMGVVTFAP